MQPKPQPITMIVRLTDGSVHRVRFIPSDEDDLQLANRIEKALQAHDLVLELGGRLLVIPKHSIVSIELTPAPAKLPAVVIRHARIID
jgi:hypothetical protein